MFAINWWEVVVMEKQDLRKFKRKDFQDCVYKALKKMELNHKIVFACDNGEREISISGIYKNKY